MVEAPAKPPTPAYMTEPRNSQSMASLSRTLLVIVAVVSAPLLNAAPGQAQDFAIVGQAGTTGLGGGVVVGLASKLNVRAMYGGFPGEPSLNIDDVDFSLGLPSFWLATVDLYALGGLRLSAGGLWITNNGTMDVVGTFDGVTVDFGGGSYTGAADDRLLGTFELKNFQPYLGIGIGNPIGKRISVGFEAGVGFGTEPIVELTAEGTLANDPIIGPTFLADLEQQEDQFESAIDLLRYYPVLSISIAFGF